MAKFELQYYSKFIVAATRVGYLEAWNIWTNTCYLSFIFDFQLWQNGNDGFDSKTINLAPYHIDVVAESFQTSKDASYCPLWAVILHARHAAKVINDGEVDNDIETEQK